MEEAQLPPEESNNSMQLFEGTLDLLLTPQVEVPGLLQRCPASREMFLRRGMPGMYAEVQPRVQAWLEQWRRAKSQGLEAAFHRLCDHDSDTEWAVPADSVV